jgi:hypothetical protein
MEEVYGISDSIFYEHPSGIPSYEPGRRATELVGEQESWPLMAEIRDGDLSNGVIVILQSNFAVNDARRSISPRDVLQFDLAPR